MRVWAAILLSVLICHPLAAVNELHVTNASLDGEGPHDGQVCVVTDNLLVAYSLRVQYPPTDVAVSNVHIDTTYLATVNANPDLFVVQIDNTAGVFTLEYAIDTTPPFSGVPLSPIPSCQDLAYFEYSAFPIVAPLSVDWSFVDGLTGSPPVVNELQFLDGTSVAVGSGLGLFSGVHQIAPSLRFTLTEGGLIEPNSSDVVGVCAVNIAGPWEGFFVALSHGDLFLQSIDIDPAVTSQLLIEFMETTLDNVSGGGAVTAIFDANPPFGGQVIAPGSSPLRLANFTYSCTNHPTHPQPNETKLISFSDGQFGFPPVDNGALIAGQSRPPFATNGSIDCRAIFPPADATFTCGPAGDPTAVGSAVAAAGTTLALGFYYSESNYEVTAFELAVAMDCLLEPQVGSFSVQGTVAAAAEFVNAAFDVDPNDGDGCEFIAAVVLDYVPPFDQTPLPVASDLSEFARLDVQVSSFATTGSVLMVDLVDGINGPGGSPFSNSLTAVQPPSLANLPIANLLPCAIHVEVPFVRGDINADGSINLADAIFLLTFLFQSGTPPTCSAAADSNYDDGVDIGDAIHLLTFVFLGGAPPSAPHPQCGAGSPSSLDCGAFAPCTP
ncbi:MAG: hypothetical protein AAF581_03935 [Planctomycetota bacterium]